AKVDGEINGAQVTVTIAINWYQADGAYPFYQLELVPQQSVARHLEAHSWPTGIEYTEGELRLHPDPENFDLEADFGRLLDAFAIWSSSCPRIPDRGASKQL
ncbi:MAG: hypothetical protein AAF550_11730, partial [Myxococcota bacterium]